MVKNVVITDDDIWGKTPPWSHLKSYNPKHLDRSYIDFFNTAEKKGLKFYRSTFDWYKNRKFIKGWTVENNKWVQAFNFKPDFIMDKTALTEKSIRWKKLFSRKKIIINPSYIEELCSDKLKTFRLFPRITPRLFLVRSKKELQDNLRNVRTDMIVLKPRAGSSAKGLSICRKKEALKLRIKGDMLLQEFIDTSKGVKGLVKGVHDIRAIMIGGKFNHAFMRVPRKGLISNVSLGGRIIFLRKKQVPKKILRSARELEKKLRGYSPRLYTADFVMDGNGRPWLMEMNSKPGFFFYEEYKRLDLKKLFVDALLNAIKGSIK